MELNVTAPPQFLLGTIRDWGFWVRGGKNYRICVKRQALYSVTNGKEKIGGKIWQKGVGHKKTK